MRLRTPESTPLVPRGDGKLTDSANGDCRETMDSGDTNTKTLSVPGAVLFLSGMLLGSGTVVISRAIVNAGWYSLLFIFLTSGSQVYAAVLLGRCLVIVHQRYPSKTHIRNPYPLIGEKAFGPYVGTLVRVTNNLCNFATAVLLMLLTAQSVQSILLEAGHQISYCYWVVITSAILVPISWLGTPKDFWFAGALAFVFIVLALVLMVALMSQKIYQEGASEFVNPPRFESYLLSLGSMFYVYSGTGLFPTVQEDMEHPSKFTTVVVLSLTFLTFWYMLVGWLGALAFGAVVHGNVIQSLPRVPVRTAVEVMVAFHFLFSTNICINPVAQDIENIECFNVPHHFNVKRCAIRTSIIVVIAFIALSVPNFSGLVSLVGAVLSQILALTMPCLLYLRLSVMEGPWPSNPVPVQVKIFCGLIISMSVVGGVASTYVSIVNLFSVDTFVPPCYVNITAASGFG